MPNSPAMFKVKKPAVKQFASQDEERENANRRGYNARWRKFRKQFLMTNPLCVHCYENGLMTPANEVDHIIPHRGDQRIFWDYDNLQALCKPCHSRKTHAEMRLV